MQTKPKDSSEIVRNIWDIHTAKHLIFLVLIIWAAHYFTFRSFGLYEDDYTYISPALGWRLSDVLYNMIRVSLTGSQGRPLGYFLSLFLAFVGAKLGGLQAIYLLGFLIHVFNACLFYVVLRKVSSETVAVIGALSFGLFPADTTHIFLMHAFGLHTSLTFLLLAGLCYISGYRTLSYFVIVGSLLTYESPYLVFLAIPLLNRNWDSKLAREIIRHVAILSGIILMVVLIRFCAGESRILTVGASAFRLAIISAKIEAAMVIGPVVSMAAFAYGPAWVLCHWNRDLTIVFAGCIIPFLWIAGQLNSQTKITTILPFSKLVPTAAIMLCLAYGFSFTHFPPIALYGRLTSVHLAAAFGGSLLFACVCSMMLSAVHAYHWRIFVRTVLALYLSLLVTYRFSIQQDFKQAWQNERIFWTSAIGNLPDMTDGTVIFVSDQNLPATHFIRSNSWADPLVLMQIIQFPKEWKNQPRLFVVHDDWAKRLIREGNQVKWQVPAARVPSHWEILPNKNVILLEMENGKLVRKFGSIVVDGQPLELRQRSANGPFAHPVLRREEMREIFALPASS